MGKMSKIHLSLKDINLASISNLWVFSPTHIFLHGEKMNLAVALSLITSKQKLYKTKSEIKQTELSKLLRMWLSEQLIEN